MIHRYENKTIAPPESIADLAAASAQREKDLRFATERWNKAKAAAATLEMDLSLADSHERIAELRAKQPAILQEAEAARIDVEDCSRLLSKATERLRRARSAADKDLGRRIEQQHREASLKLAVAMVAAGKATEELESICQQAREHFAPNSLPAVFGDRDIAPWHRLWLRPDSLLHRWLGAVRRCYGALPAEAEQAFQQLDGQHQAAVRAARERDERNSRQMRRELVAWNEHKIKTGVRRIVQAERIKKVS